MSKLIVANLKMNLNYEEAKQYKEALKLNYKEDLVVCPSYIYLDLMKSDNYSLGSQNGYYIDHGAYTGEISYMQLNSIGVEYSIIGHSERRHIFEESDDLVAKKLDNCIKHNITPIVCVGETIEEKNSGRTFEAVGRQLRNSLSDIKLDNIIIAYEPVWAIGSNQIPSKTEIEEIHIYIKKILKDIYNIDGKVLYGGSVNLQNAKDIISINGVDGLLIGTASLNPSNLIDIIASTKM